MDQHLRQSKFTRLRQGFSRFFANPLKAKNISIRFSTIRSNKGSALIMATIFMLVASVLIVTGMKLVATSARESKEQEIYIGEAENVARAGLIDAMGWFRRQNGLVTSYTGQSTPGSPVTWGTNGSGVTYTYVDQPFAPVNSQVNAQKSDTLDPNIGLVNEYSVDSADLSTDANVVYFARYEVKQQIDPLHPNPALTMTPWVVPTITCTPNPNAVHDITGQRTAGLVNGDGNVWSITSTGYVYKRQDKTFANGTPTPGVFYFPGSWQVPYNQAPNKIVATARVVTEFKKLVVNLPKTGATTWYAAVYCNKASTDVFLDSPTDQTNLNGAVSATGTYSCISMGTAVAANAIPAASDGTNLNGPTTYQSSNNQLNATSVFGMSLNDVQFLADYRGDVNNPLNIQSDWKLSYYNGNLTYGFGNPAPYDRLHTNGILVVNGDLVLQGGGPSANPLPSSFGGLVFCTGNVTIQNGSGIDGCLILGKPYLHGAGLTPGILTLSGQPANFGYINLNTNLVATALQLVATYREDVTARKTLLAVPGFQ